MAPILAAVAQMTSTPSIAHNIRTVLGLIERASNLGAKIIFLPEAADFIAPPSQAAELSRPLWIASNDFLRSISESTENKDIWVNVSIHERTYLEHHYPHTGKYFNTSLVMYRGSVIGFSRQMNARDGQPIQESNIVISPGHQLMNPIPNTPVGNLGLQTCFDVRSSRPLHSLLSDEKAPATAISYPSTFATDTGAAHWETLLRARAIEGQCYVFGSAQTGEHYAGRKSYGHAMIVDPWGTVVAQCPQTNGPALCIAEVDLNYVKKIRREMPMGWPEL